MLTLEPKGRRPGFKSGLRLTSHDISWQALAEAMAENSDLTSMELESCFVEDDGAQAILNLGFSVRYQLYCR